MAFLLSGESMKKISFLLAALFSMNILAVDKPNQAGIDVGQYVLNGDMSVAYKDSLGFGLHYRLMSSEQMSFLADYGFSSHSSGNFKKNHLVFDLAYHAQMFENFQLIPEGGLGFYYYSVKDTGGHGSALTMGINLGLEAQLRLQESFSFGPKIMFHIPFDKNVEVGSNNYNISGSYWAVLLSFNFLF